VPRRKSSGGTVNDEPQQQPASDGTSFVRGFWSGNLSFGLVSIPVSLITAQRSNRVSLRMLAPDGTQLRRRFFCPNDNVALDNGEIVRGYEVEKDRFVVVTDEELEALVPKLSQEIDLTRFVPLADIDPMRFEHGYFLVPSKKAGKAYRLLAKVMEDRARAGIATFVMRGKQYLVAIIARGGLLRAYTLRFADELRSITDAQVDATSTVDEQAVTAFQRHIEALRGDTLEASDLEDSHSRELLALIEKKRKGGKDVIAAQVNQEDEAVGAQIVDLMEYLKKSIGGDAAEPTEKPKRPRSAKRKAATAQPKKPRRTRPT
jgi:DNA end-binding protein Ku